MKFIYKGGECSTCFEKIHSIMLYGGHCSLEEKFLEQCRRHDIPVCIHKRNLAKATWILSNAASNRNDLLTRQIVYRTNEKKRLHIARRLLESKFKSMQWLIPSGPSLEGIRSVDKMRNLESHHAKQYWKEYFTLIGEEGNRRVGSNPVRSALDAVSKFYSSIFLRWILYHKFSPYHGFLHTPSDYPGMVYDLMEPFRGYIEKWVYDAILEAKQTDPETQNFTAIAISKVEKNLDQRIFAHPTRQIVTFQELFHGAVLALRAYLVGDAKRFIPPQPSKPRGGRPVQTGYRLYGRSAGPTDFWKKAYELAATQD